MERTVVSPVGASANYTQKRIFKPACKVTKEDGRSAVLLQYVEGENTGGWAARRSTSVRQGSLQEEKA